jgi:hypothetical protein
MKMNKNELNIQQKIARKIVNYLVEKYFKNGIFFYGSGPMSIFEITDFEDGRAIGGTAALSLCLYASINNALSVKYEIEQVTINDEDHGDWVLTIEKKKD